MGRFFNRRPGIKYSSASTRTSSLQGFMGGAEIDEEHEGLRRTPYDENENLEAKFKSGVNRTDIPRMWGYPNVLRKMAPRKATSLASEISGWRRVGGRPT